MSLKSITAVEAQSLLSEGALLIDIRETTEHAQENIAGAWNVPLSSIASMDLSSDRVIVFHCKGGSRTKANADALLKAAGKDAFVLEGGIESWKANGLPVKLAA
jgi:rhodanese-related sulfurtransferase